MIQLSNQKNSVGSEKISYICGGLDLPVLHNSYLFTGGGFERTWILEHPHIFIYRGKGGDWTYLFEGKGQSYLYLQEWGKVGIDHIILQKPRSTARADSVNQQ